MWNDSGVEDEEACTDAAAWGSPGNKVLLVTVSLLAHSYCKVLQSALAELFDINREVYQLSSEYPPPAR